VAHHKGKESIYLQERTIQIHSQRRVTHMNESRDTYEWVMSRRGGLQHTQQSNRQHPSQKQPNLLSHISSTQILTQQLGKRPPSHSLFFLSFPYSFVLLRILINKGKYNPPHPIPLLTSPHSWSSCLYLLFRLLLNHWSSTHPLSLFFFPTPFFSFPLSGPLAYAFYIDLYW